MNKLSEIIPFLSLIFTPLAGKNSLSCGKNHWKVFAVGNFIFTAYSEDIHKYSMI